MSDVGGSPASPPPAGFPPAPLVAVRWPEVLPWLLIVRALRVAFMVRVIVLAIVGVLATQAGWSLVEWMSAPYDEPALVRITDRRAPSLIDMSGTDSYDILEVRYEGEVVSYAKSDIGLSHPLSPQELDQLTRVADPSTLFNRVDSWSYSGPLARGWAWAIQPFTELRRADTWGRWFSLHLAGLWTIAVWALFGGAMARIAAVHLTRGETIGPFVALKAAIAKWPSTAGAPACAYLFLAALALPLLAAGFVVRLDFFAFFVGLVWILVLLVGLAAAVWGLGLLFGWPLMWSTVAVERTDAFDGISRAYAYVYQRPLHAVFFVIVASVLGLVGQTALSTFVDASLRATYWLTSVGAGRDRAAMLVSGGGAPAGPQLSARVAADGQVLVPGEASVVENPAEGGVEPTSDSTIGVFGRTGGKAMRFWTHFFAWIATTFPMAYLWPAATAIYLLLRRLIDATDLGESSYDEPPSDRGFPTLSMDSTLGVPQILRDAPTAAAPAE